MTTADLGAPLGKAGNRERSIVLGLAAIVAVLFAMYLGLRTTATGGGAGGSLMPYQMLVRDVVSTDQAMFEHLREALLKAESGRSRTGQWPAPAMVSRLNAMPVAGSSASVRYTWALARQHIIVNYLGLPEGEASAAAWLLRIQEPDPLSAADTAPNDEEHHRLPDGTVLHVSIWTHRFGGQMTPEFFPKPELAGWTQLLTAPVGPLGPAWRITPSGSRGAGE